MRIFISNSFLNDTKLTCQQNYIVYVIVINRAPIEATVTITRETASTLIHKPEAGPSPKQKQGIRDQITNGIRFVQTRCLLLLLCG